MHPMLNGLSREKRREKILSLSFTVSYLKTVSDGTLPIVFVVERKQYIYVLVAGVYCAEAKDMPTSSGILALG
jgi:hypothetical protein